MVRFNRGAARYRSSTRCRSSTRYRSTTWWINRSRDRLCHSKDHHCAKSQSLEVIAVEKIHNTKLKSVLSNSNGVNEVLWSNAGVNEVLSNNTGWMSFYEHHRHEPQTTDVKHSYRAQDVEWKSSINQASSMIH